MRLNGPTSEMQDLAARLIAYETAAANPANPTTFSALLVCEKLRDPLSMLAGNAGSRALVSRALIVARSELKSLEAIRVTGQGNLEGFDKLAPEIATEAGMTLVSQIIALLVTFIGEALTLQLVKEQWPDLPASALGRSQTR